MADWYGAFRSNYFKVKDSAAFEAWAASLESEVEVFRSNQGFGLGAYSTMPWDRTLNAHEQQAIRSTQDHLEVQQELEMATQAKDPEKEAQLRRKLEELEEPPEGFEHWREAAQMSYDPEDATLGDFELEFDFAGELAAHLAPGEVAIIQECGHEKLRYLTGMVIVIDPEAEEPVRSINIDSYQELLMPGKTPSPPQW